MWTALLRAVRHGHLRRGRQLSGFSRNVRSGFVGPHDTNIQLLAGAYLTLGLTWLGCRRRRSVQISSTSTLSEADATFGANDLVAVAEVAVAGQAGVCAGVGCLLDGAAAECTAEGTADVGWLCVGVVPTDGSRSWHAGSIAQPYIGGKVRVGGATGGGGPGGASASGVLRAFVVFAFLPA